ncbi:T9SS type A sorting domain-containing protein [Flavobacterium sp. 25HG05S-40]|uniref:T9SS type A sorting domain-containing protein n=1 Tax=Flavobacterium sp. 25HG05S-40 TaxID=3458682 RepID=UPI0040445B7B
MKNLLHWQQFLCCVSLFICNCNASFSQDILWEKSYGGKHADYLFDIIPTPDNGFILAGSSLSKKTGSKTEDNRGDLDYWVWKMDEKGELDWQKTFGGSGQDILRKITLTNDGGFLLAGSSDSEEGLDKKDKCRGDSDFWIIKLNAKGGEEWQKTIGGIGLDDLNCIEKTDDGGFIIGGSSSSNMSGEKTQNSYGNLDYWVLKIDSKGQIVWQQTFGGKYSDELRSISITPDEGLIIGGSSNSPETGNKTQKNIGESDYWVIKLDKDGIQQWQKNIGGTGDDQLYIVHTSIDGNYILGGNSSSERGEDKRSSNKSGTDFWVLKLDKETREILWQETYNFSKTDVLTSLVENNDKTILIGGYAQGEIVENKKPIKQSKKTLVKKEINQEDPKVKKGTDDFIALKITEKGEELWRKNVGSDGQDILRKVIESRDGGYLMAGTSKTILNVDGGVKATGDKSTGFGNNDFWVVKLKDKKKPKVEKKLLEAVPNPATDYTNVIVGYQYSRGIAILVDIAGHILQQFDIKESTIPIDLNGLPEGIYIVNIKTDIQENSVKIIKSNKRN